jgi:5-methylcytosine-specific restriction endonuclease McrA
MTETLFINDPIKFQNELKLLREKRVESKTHEKRGRSLSLKDRVLILQKTGGLCHVCGREISISSYEADHVKSHAVGGKGVADNYLPACKTCNNYRWHYLPDEIQWALKLGVWARTQIEEDTAMGKIISASFIKKEIVREKRRKKARTD